MAVHAEASDLGAETSPARKFKLMLVNDLGRKAEQTGFFFRRGEKK